MPGRRRGPEGPVDGDRSSARDCGDRGEREVCRGDGALLFFGGDAVSVQSTPTMSPLPTVTHPVPVTLEPALVRTSTGPNVTLGVAAFVIRLHSARTAWTPAVREHGPHHRVGPGGRGQGGAAEHAATGGVQGDRGRAVEAPDGECRALRSGSTGGTSRPAAPRGPGRTSRTRGPSTTREARTPCGPCAPAAPLPPDPGVLALRAHRGCRPQPTGSPRTCRSADSPDSGNEDPLTQGPPAGPMVTARWRPRRERRRAAPSWQLS